MERESERERERERERESVWKRGTWPNFIVQSSSFDSLFSQKCSCGAGMIICLLIALQRHIWLNVYKNNLLTAPHKFFSWRGKRPPTFSVENIACVFYGQQLVRIRQGTFYLGQWQDVHDVEKKIILPFITIVWNKCLNVKPCSCKVESLFYTHIYSINIFIHLMSVKWINVDGHSFFYSA